MKRFFLLLAAYCLLPTAYCVASLSDAIDATCRVTSGNGRGTGCAFELSSGHVYVLTAAHVADGQTVQCEFWRDGHMSAPLPGEVIRRNPAELVDSAIIAIDVEEFAGVLPKVIPMAPRGYVLKPGATITSVGCAKGAWSTGWKGHAQGYSGTDLHFTPPPANGRSGSAIFNADATMIVGLLRARTIDDRQGIATSIQALYKGFGSGSSQASHKTQWRGSPRCPDGNCPIQSQQSPKYRVLPYRQQRETQPGPVWPTLPQGQTPAPQCDMSETNGRLDVISNSLDRLIHLQHLQPPPVLPPPPPSVEPDPEPAEPDPAITEAIETNTAGIGELRQTTAGLAAQGAETAGQVEVLKDIAEQTNETVRETNDTMSAFTTKHGSVGERVAARTARVKEDIGEDASKMEFMKAYVRDLVTERATGKTDDKLAIGTILSNIPLPIAVVIGLLLFVAFRVIKGKRESGEPLLINTLAERLPEAFQGVGQQIIDKVDRRFDGVDGKLDAVKAVAEVAAKVGKK